MKLFNSWEVIILWNSRFLTTVVIATFNSVSSIHRNSPVKYRNPRKIQTTDKSHVSCESLYPWTIKSKGPKNFKLFPKKKKKKKREKIRNIKRERKKKGGKRYITCNLASSVSHDITNRRTHTFVTIEKSETRLEITQLVRGTTSFPKRPGYVTNETGLRATQQIFCLLHSAFCV